MINKFVSYFFPTIFAIIVDIGIHSLLQDDGNLTHQGMWVVLFSCGLITFLFVEWIIFKIEWVGFKKEFQVSKIPKTQTDLLLNQFAESNFLMEKISQSVKQDLEFDKAIKMDKQHLDFHLFLSKLKYNDYLPSHFIYSADNRLISKIPTYFFEKIVWRKLVETSDIYLSLQILDCYTEDVYINNIDRQQREINYLDSQLVRSGKMAKLKSFQKLFIIEDQWIDIANRDITNESVKKYLKVWIDRIGQNEKAKLKIMRYSDAQGVINGDKLDDIGIFGNILGIQSIVPATEESFIANNVRINFYFNQSTVDKYKSDFKTIFKRSCCLKEFFVPAEDLMSLNNANIN